MVGSSLLEVHRALFDRKSELYLSHYVDRKDVSAELSKVLLEERDWLEAAVAQKLIPPQSVDQVAEDMILESTLTDSPQKKLLDQAAHELRPESRQLLARCKPRAFVDDRALAEVPILDESETTALKTYGQQFFRAWTNVRDLFCDRSGKTVPGEADMPAWVRLRRTLTQLSERLSAVETQPVAWPASTETLDPNTVIENLRSLFGVPPAAITLAGTSLPVPGMHIERGFRSASVLLFDPNRNQGPLLPALLHEFGHALDHMTGDEPLASYAFATPIAKETMAMRMQKLPETPHVALALPQDLGMARAAKRYRVQQLKYLALICELDYFFWFDRPQSAQEFADFYVDRFKRQFGQAPLSPWGFAGEAVHVAYPFYLKNYICGEFVSFLGRQLPLTREGFGAWKKSLYCMTSRDFVEATEAAFESRMLDLEDSAAGN